MLSVLVLLLAVSHGHVAPSEDGEPLPPGGKDTTLALHGAKIHPSPSEAAIEKGVVLVRDGRIIAVGQDGSVTVPPDAARVDCTGLTLTAGFWNSHVHFIEPKWEKATRPRSISR
jgi:predicted amidohydrolase YtcJ